MKIFITRHGESEANILKIISNRDLPHHLTPKGIAQAHDLANKLQKRDIQRIFFSPIPRARQTAEIIAMELGIPSQTADALREFDCGGMESRGDPDALAAHHTVMEAWLTKKDTSARIPPDGENYEDMKARFLPFINELVKKGEDALLITHGALLLNMLPLVLTNIDDTFCQAHLLGNCELVIAETGSSGLTCVEWAGERVS
jgi:probable phosphoglycerate mutase